MHGEIQPCFPPASCSALQCGALKLQNYSTLIRLGKNANNSASATLPAQLPGYSCPFIVTHVNLYVSSKSPAVQIPFYEPLTVSGILFVIHCQTYLGQCRASCIGAPFLCVCHRVDTGRVFEYGAWIHRLAQTIGSRCRSRRSPGTRPACRTTDAPPNRNPIR